MTSSPEAAVEGNHQAQFAEARRVALYLPDLHGGGAERMMVSLARGFVSRDLAVDVVLARAQGPYLDELPPAARVIDLEASGVLASIPRLAAYLRRNRPAAAIATLPHASIALVIANALSLTRTRVFIRESTTPSGVKPGNDIRERVMPLAMRLVYPWATGVVGVSRGVSADLREFLGLSEDKVHTIYNPVISDGLPVLAAEAIQHPWFEDGERRPVILSVGRLVPEKRFPTLIEAVAKLAPELGVRLVILGEGPERSRLESLVAQLGLQDVVDLPGFVSNPFAYMARADVYVLSSEREGLPGALIQAMGCGCPVVSTDCPSGPAEVLAGGEYGELVPVDDPVAMAEAIAKTLRDPLPADRLIERAKDFSEEDSIEDYLRLLLPGSRGVSPRSPRRQARPGHRVRR